MGHDPVELAELLLMACMLMCHCCLSLSPMMPQKNIPLDETKFAQAEFIVELLQGYGCVCKSFNLKCQSI